MDSVLRHVWSIVVALILAMFVAWIVSKVGYGDTTTEMVEIATFFYSYHKMTEQID